MGTSVYIDASEFSFVYTENVSQGYICMCRYFSTYICMYIVRILLPRDTSLNTLIIRTKSENHHHYHQYQQHRWPHHHHLQSVVCDSLFPGVTGGGAISEIPGKWCFDDAHGTSQNIIISSSSL